MQQHQFQADLDTLNNQLLSLKDEMDKAIKDGKNFVEVKSIHLQVKELSRLIEQLKSANDRSYTRQIGLI